MKKRAKNQAPKRSKRPKPGAAEPGKPLVLFDGAIVADLRDMLPATEFDGLLRRAEETLPAVVEELRQAWTGRDKDETRRHAHKLAGLAGNFGCLALMAAARKIEAACEARPARPQQQLIRDLDHLLPPTLDALRLQHIENPPERGG